MKIAQGDGEEFYGKVSGHRRDALQMLGVFKKYFLWRMRQGKS